MLLDKAKPKPDVSHLFNIDQSFMENSIKSICVDGLNELNSK